MTFPPQLDTRSIGLFRVLLGSVLMVDLLLFRLPNLEAFYIDGAIIERAMSTDVNRLGLMNIIATRLWATVFFGSAFAAYLCFTLGYRVRLFGMLSLCCLWSIHQRSPIIIATDDQAIICLLFWGLFLPLGEQFTPFRSLERPNPRQVNGLPAFAILLQIAIIYFLNGHPKTGVTWTSGVAISYALMEDLWAKPSAAILLGFPEMCRALTHIIRPVEFSIPILIFCPVANQVTRAVAAAVILAFHWGIFTFISLGLFPLIATTWAAILLPSFLWNRIGARQGVRATSATSPRSRASKLHQRVGSFVLLSALGIACWNAGFQVDSVRSRLPRLTLPAVLGGTSLFSQHWALYAPDATIESKWIKIEGRRPGKQSIDLWTGLEFSFDNAGVSAYQTEPWQNLAWHILYGTRQTTELAGRWARFERDRWNRAHPEQPVNEVHVVEFSRTILGHGTASAITFHVRGRSSVVPGPIPTGPPVTTSVSHVE